MTFNGTHIQSLRVHSLGLMALAVAALGGCLDRPIAPTKPETNNVFVKQNPSGGIDKIDVLFMIDNSLSMGDKQEVLAAAVPQLLGRLTNPDCVDPNNVAAPQHLNDPSSACPNGLQREFSPVKDIHIGVVSSSLGDYGGDTCPEEGAQNLAQNDHAWLLGALPRAGLATPFLSWSAADASNYASGITAKQGEFGTFVRAATELGCGNEMSLEAWYRFLIDPKPPTDVVTVGSGPNSRGPVDNEILKQRAAFMRPDSLLAVFMLTDENDCSMRDSGSYAWVAMSAGNGFRMWRGSSPCATNPNDPCCFSCMLADSGGISAACLGRDTTCHQDAASKLTLVQDDVNMRCRSMKRRFGFDFLFPPKRYVIALTKPQICPDSSYGDLDCDCTEARAKGIGCSPGAPVPNPIYTNLNPGVVPTGPERTSADAVFLAGVVGVPWQDLAVDPSDGATLQYKRAGDLDWNLFAPKVDEDYSTATLGDPLMVESSQPRTGRHPITGQDIAGPDAARNANKINGHEWNTSDKDVEFACIFSLEVKLTDKPDATRTCDLVGECGAVADTDDYKKCARKFDGCSCTLTAAGATATNPLDPTVSKSPLCQTTTNTYGNKQFFAKAYPGLRELQVLRGFYEATSADNAIVGSICPKDLNPANKTGAGYGYNPAVKALVDRLKEKLTGTCLPRKLAVDTEGKVPCAIVESISKTADANWCNCEANGRTKPLPELESAIKNALRNEQMCDVGALPSCDTFCFCQLNQLTAGTPNGDRCLTQLNVEKNSPAPGFCYVDPSQNQGNADVVAACPGTEKRIIRIIGASEKYLSAPAPGRVFYACSGSAYQAP